MSRITKIIICLLVVIFLTPTFGMAAEKPFKIKTCWFASLEAFVPWYYKEMGWDKKMGLDIEMILFDSGPAMLEAIPSKTWDAGNIGAVPAIWGAIRYNTKVVGITYMDDLAEGVLARKDSAATKTKGWNKDYPDVLGTPESVKGKTFLTTMITSAHYAMSNYLKVFGLTDKDVVVKNMSQSQAVAAFETGVGDFLALWAPHQFYAEDKGAVEVGTLKTTKAPIMQVLIARDDFAKEHQEQLLKFLTLQIKGQELINKNPEKFAKEVQRFYLEWCGYEVSEELCLRELKARPFVNYQGQLDAFKGSPFESKAFQWQKDLTNFFVNVGKIKPEEAEKAIKTPYLTDKYLNMIGKNFK